ncbi:MAG: T9SS type A sorting domain-containing protein, partial [candidate division WOR-3 bacterium]|nr:T9SS type A sorting domain-containing protein [candidate division WOR-3 bacterium]
FYLENRQQKGFDSPLPGPGLLIWHIDPSRGAMHNVVDLEEDSTFHLDHGSGIRPDPHIYHQALGDTSDPLPGNWNRTVFDNYSIPNSKDNRGIPTNISFRNIHQVGDTIICDITLLPVHIADKPQPVKTNKVIAAPNPFSKFVSLKIETTDDKNYEPGVVTVYSVNGNLVYKTLLPKFRQLTWFGVDETGKQLPTGVYLMRIGIDDCSYSHKLVIQR